MRYGRLCWGKEPSSELQMLSIWWLESLVLYLSDIIDVAAV